MKINKKSIFCGVILTVFIIFIAAIISTDTNETANVILTHNSTDSNESAIKTTDSGETIYTTCSDDIEIESDKLIYYGSMTIESKDYIQTLKDLKEVITEYDGVIITESESEKQNEWYGTEGEKTKSDYIQIRIPADKFVSFMAGTEENCMVVSKAIRAENVSKEYSDIQTEIKSLKIQQEKLLSMMESCTTIDDMISVDERLTEIQDKLTEAQNKMNNLEQDIAYSYVTITLNEVKSYSSGNIIERIKYRFAQSWDIFIVAVCVLVEVFILIIPFLLVCGIIYLLFSKKIKEKRRKKEEELKKYDRLEEKIDQLLNQYNKK